MFKRLAFAIFFCLGGFLFVIPYWLLFGTKASRERKRLAQQQNEIIRRMNAEAAATSPTPPAQ